jgi:hypothetical protein
MIKEAETDLVKRGMTPKRRVKSGNQRCVGVYKRDQPGQRSDLSMLQARLITTWPSEFGKLFDTFSAGLS